VLDALALDALEPPAPPAPVLLASAVLDALSEAVDEIALVEAPPFEPPAPPCPAPPIPAPLDVATLAPPWPVLVDTLPVDVLLPVEALVVPVPEPKQQLSSPPVPSEGRGELADPHAAANAVTAMSTAAKKTKSRRIYASERSRT
jgi:hypothetical protein